MRFLPPTKQLLAVALLTSMAVVVGLLNRLSDAKAEARRLGRRAAFLYDGAFVPAARTKTLTGDSLTLGEPRDPWGRQLVLVFTTTCPFCKATLPVWQQLADSVHRANPSVEVVGVSLDSVGPTTAYQAAHRLPYPVVVLREPRLVALYRARMVPLTAVIEPGGRVRYAAMGQLRVGAVLDSVYRAVLRGPATELDQR